MSVVEGWTTLAIEECCDILDNKRVPVNAEEREKRIGEVPYYGANGLQGYIDDFIFDEQLILIAEDGGRFDEFSDRPIAYQISGKSWVNNHAHVLRAKSGFFQNTIFYSLEHKDIQSFIVGGTRAKLNQLALRSITIDLPKSKTEQKKIAEVLSTVDRAIEQTEALISKQQRIKTGLMQDLLTRGIDEQGNLRTEDTHEFKDSPLGRIPVEWEAKSVDELLAEGIISGVQDGNHGELHPKSNEFVSEGVPFIMASDISGGVINLEKANKITEKQYKGLRIGFSKGGDVLLSHKASIGFVAEVPNEIDCLMLTPQVTYYRVGDLDRMLPNYLAQFLRSESFQVPLKGLAKQSTRDYIGILAQRKLYLAFPREIDEQSNITSLLAVKDNMVNELRQLLGKYKALKAALMQDLLTGKKRINPLLKN